GSTLPETGGMGTTIFYVIGAILVIGAGVVLITRKRMSASK
ncbi:MAG: LPXTG cell wall anchor domain-containing protein, partial [Oliverpabstia sp.]